jgi:hypothetical protein
LKKVLIFSNSAKVGASSRKRATEIYLYVKQLKGLQEDKNFVVGNRMADYLVKKGKRVSRTCVCEQSFYSAKLRVKINIQTYLSRYCVDESQYRPWNKM